jgi:hypothetical protein
VHASYRDDQATDRDAPAVIADRCVALAALIFNAAARDADALGRRVVAPFPLRQWDGGVPSDGWARIQEHNRRATLSFCGRVLALRLRNTPFPRRQWDGVVPSDGWARILEHTRRAALTFRGRVLALRVRNTLAAALGDGTGLMFFLRFGFFMLPTLAVQHSTTSAPTVAVTPLPRQAPISFTLTSLTELPHHSLMSSSSVSLADKSAHRRLAKTAAGVNVAVALLLGPGVGRGAAAAVRNELGLGGGGGAAGHAGMRPPAS